MRGILIVTVLMSLALPAICQKGSWDDLGKLKTGNRVKITQTNLKVVEGKFVRFSDENLTVKAENQEVVIPREQVYRVMRKTRARNTEIGLAAGLGLGAAVAACCIEREENYPAAIAGTVALTTGLGGGIGAAIPSYTTVFQADKPKDAAAKAK